MADQPARRMLMGVMPPTSETAFDGQTAHFRDYVAMAQMAEQIGFDSFWLADHLLYRYPEQTDRGAWEVFTLLSGLAAVTQRIQLGPLVACTAFRNPALLAKIAETLDDVSDGRLQLGLGAGWHEPEFTAYGYPFDHLAGRFEEALGIIVPMLREGRADFSGTYYQARDVALRPRGPHRNGPPIWIGAFQPRMLRLVARYADVFNTVWPTDPAEVTKAWQSVLAACEEIGRDPSTLTLTAGVPVRLLAEGGTPVAGESAIAGTVPQVAEALDGFRAIGVRHLIVSLRPQGLATIERFRAVLDLLDA